MTTPCCGSHLLRESCESNRFELAESGRLTVVCATLYEYFAPVREEILRRGISEEEVNADIDAAIAEVRAEQRAKAA